MSAHTIGSPIGATSGVDLETTDSAVPSEVDLLCRARLGDDGAFAVLWRRHLPAAYAVATRFRGRVSAEDLVAEASARILRLLREGGGPTDNFRSYFASTVRTVGVDAVRREMSVVPTETPDLEVLAHVEPDVSALAGSEVDTDLVRDAFRLLGEADQLLLWHTMVEGSAPRVVAPLLGVSANAVSARAMRARDALRNNYLDVWVQRRVPACGAPECRWALDHLGGFVRGKLTARQRARVSAHLAQCPRDAGLEAELKHVHDRFGAVTGPLVLVAGAAMAGQLGHGPMAALVAGQAAGAGAAGTATVGATATATGAAAVGSTAAGGTVATTSAAAAGATGATASATAATTATVTTGVASSATATATAAVTAASTASTATATAAVGATAVATLPVAAGVAGSAALVSGVAGGSVLAGSTLGPTLATALAGLVVGLGVTAPAAAHEAPAPSLVAVVADSGSTVPAGVDGAVGSSPSDLLQLVDLQPALPGSDAAPTSSDVLAQTVSTTTTVDATVSPAEVTAQTAPTDPAPVVETTASTAGSSPAAENSVSLDPQPSDGRSSDPVPVEPAGA